MGTTLPRGGYALATAWCASSNALIFSPQVLTRRQILLSEHTMPPSSSRIRLATSAVTCPTATPPSALRLRYRCDPTRAIAHPGEKASGDNGGNSNGCVSSGLAQHAKSSGLLFGLWRAFLAHSVDRTDQASPLRSLGTESRFAPFAVPVASGIPTRRLRCVKVGVGVCCIQSRKCSIVLSACANNCFLSSSQPSMRTPRNDGMSSLCQNLPRK